jgi:hypothetical protein
MKNIGGDYCSETRPLATKYGNPHQTPVWDSDHGQTGAFNRLAQASATPSVRPSLPDMWILPRKLKDVKVERR